jgi:hypothetical protein
MADRRKIVIPVEPETPHFDAEETLLSARPVVPISHEESAPVFDSPQVVKRAPFYRRSLFLPLLVIAAVGIGLAAGLAIARYRYLQRSGSPVVSQPVQAPAVNDTRTTTTATVQTPNEDEQAQAPVLPEVKIEEKTTVDDTREDDAKTATRGASSRNEEDDADRRNGDKEDNARTTAPPATREKRRTNDDETETAQDSPRAQRRERRARNRAEDVDDIPRRVERASEQINRIREIFEGRPQRP